MKLIDNSLKSFYVKGKLPQWAIWMIGVALFAAAWFGVAVWARASALNALSKHIDNWDDSGILEQETSYTCVPASIVMLLKDHGIDTTTYEIAVISGTDTRGTGGNGIIKTGEHFRFNVTHEHLAFDEFFERGLPAIVIFRYKGIRHAAYVSPMPDVGYIEVKDSIQGLLHFKKEGADDYFGGEKWDVYLFERDLPYNWACYRLTPGILFSFQQLQCYSHLLIFCGNLAIQLRPSDFHQYFSEIRTRLESRFY